MIGQHLDKQLNIAQVEALFLFKGLAQLAPVERHYDACVALEHMGYIREHFCAPCRTWNITASGKAKLRDMRG